MGSYYLRAGMRWFHDHGANNKLSRCAIYLMQVGFCFGPNSHAILQKTTDCNLGALPFMGCARWLSGLSRARWPALCHRGVGL